MIGTFNALVGWSAGYSYCENKNKENEIKQGNNYYLAAPWQFAQSLNLAILIHKINAILPKSLITTPVHVFCHIFPLVTLPAALFCASVKQGHYEAIAQKFNQSKFAYLKLPEKLSHRSEAFFGFIADKGGDILRVAMIVSSVALIALGQTLYGAAALLALTYNAIDRRGYVPNRMSLLMESYMPAIALLGTVLGGTPLLRVISALNLTSRFSAYGGNFIFHKIDQVAKYVFSLKGPTLKEIDAPLIIQNSLSFEEIVTIINGRSEDYEINPAHCAKSAAIPLPTNYYFDDFLTLFDKIDWHKKISVLNAKLKNSSTFNLNASKGKEKTPNETIKWMRDQLKAFVEVLKGEKTTEGTSHHIEETRPEAAAVLAYFSTLKENDWVELEDGLMKLADEGGKHCGLGIKRAVNEIYRGIQQMDLDPEKALPSKDFENQIKQNLEHLRNDIVQSAYQRNVKNFDQSEIAGALSQDTHLYETVKRLSSLGFCPLTPHERSQFGLIELGIWEFLTEEREKMFLEYRSRLDEAIKKSEQKFTAYTQEKIETNELLSDEQRTKIIDMLSSACDGWGFDEIPLRFHRLMFVQLGVLKPKNHKELTEEP